MVTLKKSSTSIASVLMSENHIWLLTVFPLTNMINVPKPDDNGNPFASFISTEPDLSTGQEHSGISKYTLGFIMKTLALVSTKNVTG